LFLKYFESKNTLMVTDNIAKVGVDTKYLVAFITE